MPIHLHICCLWNECALAMEETSWLISYEQVLDTVDLIKLLLEQRAFPQLLLPTNRHQSLPSSISSTSSPLIHPQLAFSQASQSMYGMTGSWWSVVSSEGCCTDNGFWKLLAGLVSGPIVCVYTLCGCLYMNLPTTGIFSPLHFDHNLYIS